jgi:hypothetical protein
VDDDGDLVRLTVPATAEAVRITRVAAAGLATRVGFTYREVEQMRLAVSEATSMLARLPAEGRLLIVYSLRRDGIDVEVRREDVDVDGAPLQVTVSELAAVLLDACVDGWEVSPFDGTVALHKTLTHYDDEDDVTT